MSGRKITGSRDQICRGIHQIIELLMDNFDLRDNVEWKSRLIRGAKTEGQSCVIMRSRGLQENSWAYYFTNKSSNELQNA